MDDHLFQLPRRILLATDLSGRCDRALDRAAQLVALWQAKLTVVHALEWDLQLPQEAAHEAPSWRRNRDARAAIAERQIHEDLLDHEVPFDVVIEEGEPAAVVLKAAEAYSSDLIVTGTARSETFGRLVLGATVDHLVRRSTFPVLVAKTRVRRSYGKVMVATDFSEGSLAALCMASELFPRAKITVLHCYRLISDGAGGTSKAGLEAAHQRAANDCARFLDASGLSPERRQKLEVLLEAGYIETVVKAYAADKGLDLLVVGSAGRGQIATLLFGSTAEKLLTSAPSDVLVVRAT